MGKSIQWLKKAFQNAYTLCFVAARMHSTTRVSTPQRKSSRMHFFEWLHVHKLKPLQFNEYGKNKRSKPLCFS